MSVRSWSRTECPCSRSGMAVGTAACVVSTCGSRVSALAQALGAFLPQRASWECPDTSPLFSCSAVEDRQGLSTHTKVTRGSSNLQPCHSGPCPGLRRHCCPYDSLLSPQTGTHRASERGCSEESQASVHCPCSEHTKLGSKGQ
jgi:hypothetical protein